MKLQIIEDDRGKATGVYIPINDWKKLKKHFTTLQDIEYKESTKDDIIHELKQAIFELKLIEQGKLKARSASELLNEL